MGALIRHLFQIDPYKLTTEEFAQLSREALYLHDLNRRTIAEAIAEPLNLFSNQMAQLILASLRRR